MWKSGPSTESLQEQTKQTYKDTTKTVNNVQHNATYEYQLLDITSPGKVTPWNASVDIEEIAVSMQLDTGASKSLMSESSNCGQRETFHLHW